MLWVTMITPYTEAGMLDLERIPEMVAWYHTQGVDGIFALCQSSEVFHLSPDERMRLRDAVLDAARGRLPVIISGATSTDLTGQIGEIGRITTPEARSVVLFTNILYADGGDDTFRRNVDAILRAFPDVPFGLYECPYPAKRLISDVCLSYCAKTGRFFYMKDTCCDANRIGRRLRLIEGTPMRLYNANTATLLPTLKAGAAGYCGIMANFHPDLYTRLLRAFRAGDSQAEHLSHWLGVLSCAEFLSYPLGAKYHFTRTSSPMALISRVPGLAPLTSDRMKLLDDLIACEDMLRAGIAANAKGGH